MNTFTYPATSFGKTSTSVLSREHAERIADTFERFKVDSPYSSDYEAPRQEGRSYIPMYERHPLLVAMVADLPPSWGCDVSYILDERRKVRHFEKIRADQSHVSHPGIRAHLLALTEVQFLRSPAIADLTHLAQLAMRGDFGNRKPIYKPAPGCKARLKLKEAVMYWSEQASYADHTRYAVPVEIEEGADRAVCAANLGAFCASLRTHNGFAGSGCTWSAELITSTEGNFVVMDCRASISD